VVHVSARVASLILEIASARGADADAVAIAAGHRREAEGDPDATIPLEVENALWDAAARATADELFGLHAALAIRPGAFDVLDYAVRTAPTLRAALDRLVRYNRLVHSHAVFSLIEAADRVRIEHAFAAPGLAPGRHASDFTLAALVVIATQITGAPITPLAVELRHPPAHVAEYARVFGIAPTFERPVGALELACSDLERSCPAADSALSQVLVRHAETLLASRPDPLDSVANQVRRFIARRLGEGGVTLALAARELRLSERSLQRRLTDEGFSFDEILDDLRRELGLRYLADPKLAIGEIAYLLGYSEPSAFHRAFKRWTQMTPAQARARTCA
jgi:AraC-like DNA-binding protein